MIHTMKLYLKELHLDMQKETRAIFQWMGSIRGQYWIVALLIAIGAGIRLYKFGAIPAGLHRDEASLSYDAYSLLMYGVERNGFHWPIIFGAYGSGQSGTLAGYLSMPFLYAFGLVPIATRAVNLLFGIASLPLFYWVSRRIAGKNVALFALFLLAINPWHILISRWGWDCNLFPHLFLIALCLLVAGSEKKPWLYPLSAITMGLALYSYGTSYVFLPIFILCAIPYLLVHQKISKRMTLICATIFTMIAVPIGLFLLINTIGWPTITTPLFSIPNLGHVTRQQSALFLHERTILESIARNIGIFFSLLISQNDHALENSVQGFGFLYLFSLPITIFGIIKAGYTRIQTRYAPIMLMVCWLVCSVVVAAVLDPAIHRVNIIIFPLIFFTALGLERIRTLSTITCVFLVFAYSVSFIFYTHTYFGSYAEATGKYFSESLDTAVQDAADAVSGIICVTHSNVFVPEMTIVYQLKMDPRIFFNTVKFYNKNDLYPHTKSFDRFQIGLESCDRTKVEAYVLTREEARDFPESEYTQTMYKYFVVAIPKQASAL